MQEKMNKDSCIKFISDKSFSDNKDYFIDFMDNYNLVGLKDATKNNLKEYINKNFC